MKSTRREFICGAAAVAAAASSGGVEKKKDVRLRIAVMSDNQLRPERDNWGWYTLECALEMLKPMKVDVVLNAGDISDFDDIPTIGGYLDNCRAKLGGAEHFAVPGNHDIWLRKGSGRTHDQVIDEFYSVFGQGKGHVTRRTIGGYDFVAVASRENIGKGEYYAAEAEELAKTLGECVRRDPSKPVFVLTHYQPAGTVLGSSDAYGVHLRNVLDRFPQVVSLSGHTHCPLRNELMIWQKEFTAINTSTLHYGCYPSRRVNTVGGILPLARESVGFMVIDVFDTSIEVRRYNADDGKELTAPDERWSFDIPYCSDRPRYPESRRGVAPQFAVGARMLSRYDYGFIHFLFDPAEGRDGVEGYRLEIVEMMSGGETSNAKSYMYVSDFYRLERFRGGRVNLRAPAFSLEPGKSYRISVRPRNWFGDEGEPMALTMNVSEGYRFRNINEIYPQE